MAGITMPIGRKRMRWGRNWPCLCGSDKKYKKCCLDDINNLTALDGNGKVEALLPEIQEMIDAQAKGFEQEGVKKDE